MAKKAGCKPGSKVNVVVEEFGSIINEVNVYCKNKDAQEHYDAFIKHHFGSKKRFDEMHGETDKSDIYWYTTKLK